MHLEVPFHKNPLVGAGFWQARMTAFKVIGRFLWLYIWPARLSADYSYNSVPLFQWSLGRWEDLQAPIVLALCVAGIALALRLRRENKPVMLLCALLLYRAGADLEPFYPHRQRYVGALHVPARDRTDRLRRSAVLRRNQSFGRPCGPRPGSYAWP